MKKALITGAASGIGRAIALKLSSNFKIIIFDINEKGLKETENLIKEKGGDCKFFKVEISNYEAIEKIAEEIKPVHVIVNNAGITRDKLLIRMDKEDWDSVIRINLTGAFNICKAFVKYMVKERWGRIINISSVIGEIGNIGQTNYAASKAGLIGFTKSLAKELASRNITVNAIAPGYIETPMTEGLPQQVKEYYLKNIPLQRPGKPEDVANLINFLVSEEASYITGQIIRVDGGLVM